MTDESNNDTPVKREEPGSGEEDDEDLFNADEDEAVKPEKPPTQNGTPPVLPIESAVIPKSPATDNEADLKSNTESVLTMRIPRISASARTPAPAPAAHSPPIKPIGNGNRYGLPDDIVIPASITPSILNGRLLESLRSLPSSLITDALSEYDDAVVIKGESIRNHGAYLWGVIKRYMSVQERATSGEGETVLHMGPDLTPAVLQRLERLVSDSFCTEEEMHDKIKSKIRMLSETDALYAIEELASVDRSQIRNFGSYFMGILNRYMRGERTDLTSGKKTLAEVRQQFQSPHSNRQNDRKRGRDNEPPFHRGREDPMYRPPGQQRDRNDMGRRDARDFQDPYGPPHQNPPPSPYGGVPPMMSPSQPASRMPGGPNRFPQQTPSHQPPQMYGQNPYGPPSHQGPPQQHYAQPSMGGPPNPYGNQQQPAAYGQPPPSNFGQQQNFVSQTPYGNPQQQPSGVPGLGPPSNSYGMPPNQPAYMNQQQQQQQAQPQSYSNAPFSSSSTQQGHYGQPAGAPNQWGAAAPPQSPAPPIDIMALADKASSAVQALQNQNKLQGGMPPPQPYQQQPPPYQPQPYGQPAMNIPPSYPPGNQPYAPQQGYGANIPPQLKKRRTTASLIDLPINVQFAVQNLQATGQTGPLDDGMLGMIKDLPEDLALQGLQKFSVLDKSSMRNPTAYLAGLLRRELEKIHRR